MDVGIDARIARAEALGDQVNGHPEAVPDVVPQLIQLLKLEQEPAVVCALIYSLGHAWDEEASLAILRLIDVNSAPDEVRLAVAQSLSGGMTSKSAHGKAAQLLVQLTRDANGRVRDWACFSLGSLEVDSDEVREALVARLDDEDVEARCEALAALAALGDSRVVPYLLDRIETDSIYMLELQAAASISDPVLYPGLKALQERWALSDPDPEFDPLMEFALCRCHPKAASVAARFETQLAKALQRKSSDKVRAALVGKYPLTEVVFEGTVIGPSGESSRVWHSDARDGECPGRLNIQSSITSWEGLVDSLLLR